jgi:hypothetical protein
VTDPLEPAGKVLGEPPAPPPEVGAAVLARALDPQAAPIDAAGLLPGPAGHDSAPGPAGDDTEFLPGEAEHDSAPGPAGDDTDEWPHPDGRLTEVTADGHDDAHEPPSEDPWSPGPEPEMY